MLWSNTANGGRTMKRFSHISSLCVMVLIVGSALLVEAKTAAISRQAAQLMRAITGTHVSSTKSAIQYGRFSQFWKIPLGQVAAIRLGAPEGFSGWSSLEQAEWLADQQGSQHPNVQRFWASVFSTTGSDAEWRKHLSTRFKSSQFKLDFKDAMKKSLESLEKKIRSVIPDCHPHVLALETKYAQEYKKNSPYLRYTVLLKEEGHITENEMENFLRIYDLEGQLGLHIVGIHAPECNYPKPAHINYVRIVGGIATTEGIKNSKDLVYAAAEQVGQILKVKGKQNQIDHACALAGFSEEANCMALSPQGMAACETISTVRSRYQFSPRHH